MKPGVGGDQRQRRGGPAPRPPDHVFLLLISPLFILSFTWAIGLIGYEVGGLIGQNYSYFAFMVYALKLVPQSTPFGYLWLLLGYLFFATGVVAAGVWNRRQPPDYSNVRSFFFFKVLLILFSVTSVVAFMWIGVAIIQFGGLAAIMEVAASDNVAARDAIVGAAFPGGRLVSSGFIGIAVLCAGRLALTEVPMTFPQRLAIVGMFIVALIYLSLAPILISGRINFFIACIGSFVAASIVRGRIIGVGYLLIGVGMLAFVWTIKQYFVMGHVTDESVAQQGWQSILFYLYNDVYNALVPVQNNEGDLALGWYSLRFVFFLTFTNKWFQAYNAEAIIDAQEWMGGGEIPLLGAPYIDFGFGGLIVLLVMGYATQIVFMKCRRHFFYASAYGLIFACLLLSTHSAYLTSQEVAYNLIVIGAVGWLVTRRAPQARPAVRSVFPNPRDRSLVPGGPVAGQSSSL
ncbi:O-antigen polymerase [Ancylobacter sp. SL191]|uniref:O-antigen polymerase n=1 Tax=Ancylobacter sp. SL191 TaxID=2995166 RepID=UPI00226F2E1D|nr:O-antigen polymerase [Ancylobacter sp. SL191]WAC28696.1 O-antigen ligase [Ancylobacter sp. SL191]